MATVSEWAIGDAWRNGIRFCICGNDAKAFQFLALADKPIEIAKEKDEEGKNIEVWYFVSPSSASQAIAGAFREVSGEHRLPRNWLEAIGDEHADLRAKLDEKQEAALIAAGLLSKRPDGIKLGYERFKMNRTLIKEWSDKVFGGT